MKTKQDFLSVKDLVELRKDDMVTPNPEYQRGAVWNPDQQKKLIDSVMRGYQLPIIYLHDKKKTVAGRRKETFDIIDGQQRITALHSYVEGAFPLFAADDKRARFPKFLQDEPCLLGRKIFPSVVRRPSESSTGCGASDCLYRNRQQQRSQRPLCTSSIRLPSECPRKT